MNAQAAFIDALLACRFETLFTCEPVETLKRYNTTSSYLEILKELNG